ncbi:type II toxin-antitoxin system death-on-curing family toxin [Halochromatium roseum]|uniref:type II toxin-antitoxin system death-on-curing family toxin n=1 Tax=Halochromatium roseum TaxID=391920 RepID=UPI0019145EA4|nr:type II toxin-antitoxin system death-on-curing family toxin [Halochromatium roseum]MBK5940790.1 death-on-curing protein [Halochromatium roseum]
MRFLSLAEVLTLQQRLIATSGGADGLRDTGALESAVSQPHASFAGEDLYPDLIAKAGALGHALVMSHPFLDGNKRLGHAAMETFLVLNGQEIICELDEQESMMLTLATGEVSRAEFTEWLRAHTGALGIS